MRTQFSKKCLPTASAALAFAVMLVLSAFAATSAYAQTFKVLHTFTGTPDGFGPEGGLINVNKTFYGITDKGGEFGQGSIFKVNSKGQEVVLHSFAPAGPEGYFPEPGLAADLAGNLYGVTDLGGDHNRGSVFKLDTHGALTVLLSFEFPSSDAVFVCGDLLLDSAGNIYGMSSQGGTHNLGTVFKIDTNNTETVLYSFAGSPDGWAPCGGLVMDPAGNLYGATTYGGTSNLGTVFKLDPAGNETILHNFNGTDGARPYLSSLLLARNGNLYGTTRNGGANRRGTVFALDTAGNFHRVYSFVGKTDGSHPVGTLVRDRDGNLYGTTIEGGPTDAGTVFKISGKGDFTVLHSFDFGSGGGEPGVDLVLDKDGDIFGTAALGGTNEGGTVFEITP